MAFITQTGIVDRRRGRYAQASWQDLEIVDYLAVRNAIVADAKVPTVMITAFGVDGTHYHVGFSPRVAGPRDTAVVIHLAIRPETKQIGEAILANKPNPLPLPPPVTPVDPADIARKIQEAEEHARDE